MSDLAARPTSFVAGVRADLAKVLMQVTPENVMQTHHALQAEALRLGRDLFRYGQPTRVRVAAEDPVSKPAADGFNAKLDQAVTQIQAYVSELQAAADQTVIIAKRYGHTEESVKSSFARFDPNAPHPAQPGGGGR